MVAAAKGMLERQGDSWLVAGCSVGKTYSILALIKETEAKATLVFTTQGAMQSAWPFDIKDKTAGLDYILLDKGTSKDKAALLDSLMSNPISQPFIVVVNYETAHLIAGTIAKHAHKIDLVVADESHKLKSYNSVTSNKLAEACSSIRHKITMTGTPWDDRPTDAYGQARFLQPIVRRRGYHSSKILGTYGDFYERYVVYKQLASNIKIPVGYKNIPELSTILEPHIFRIEADDVIDLPPVIDVNRYVHFPTKVRKLYDEYAKKYIATYEGTTITADLAITLSMRLHQITSGYHPDLGRIDDTKLRTLIDILDEIGKQPTVVFTSFTDDVNHIKSVLTELGYSVKLLVGGTHEHVEFQGGEGDILIANIAAGAEGINLTRARYCIYYSKTYSRSQLVQSKARVRRYGSDLDYPITYYNIIMQGTVDESIERALSSKEDVTSVMYEGIMSYVGH